ncbi:MAG: hypothetical protein M1119_01410 [Firmicutes bacterium]|nr:hypothetical protein [Bacillota bacterium]
MSSGLMILSCPESSLAERKKHRNRPRRAHSVAGLRDIQTVGYACAAMGASRKT